MNISECKKDALGRLSGRWGKAICIFLAMFVVEFAIGFISGFFNQNSILNAVLSIAELLVTIPLSFGMVFAYLKFYRNEDVKSFDFIKLGFDNFAKSWKVSLWTLVKIIIPTILVIISYVLIATGLVTSNMKLFGGPDLTFLSIIGIILLFISMIWFITRNLYYSLANVIAMDNENMTAKEAVEASQEMMNGNRANLFLLQLSFIGWGILATITLGIGFIWLIPYMQLSIIAFYEEVRNLT